MTGDKTVALSTAALTRITAWPGGHHRPVLVLRCEENKTSARIDVGYKPDPEVGVYNEATVRIRYGDKQPVTQQMELSTDGKSVFFPAPIAHIKRMLAHKSMRIEFTPFNSDPVNFAFDLDGLNDRLSTLRQVCHW